MTRELNAIEIDAIELTMASRSCKTTCRKGDNIMRKIYLGNEAMNEKHRAHSKCLQQEMLPSHWYRKTNSLKATENHLRNQLSLSQLTTQFDSQMLL